ncbi:hypothetical protein CMQ_3685 [Grosmannia clavigera kw1407]|uniref:AA1-like domain-containing protein n=1 Tax=Grosmannia clavigera (strain kw1407 / UAMH 11150) TaxID=655863 RepID=F0X9W6_GROCL|nr:uncharacterized protein CMQ_3685 [Grosmannia clavigera kw1407]EFX05616.1 hypothetical protein CMQ_3685 [Grosmannia clavigera kw1407]
MQTSFVALLALSAGVLASPSAPAPTHAFTCKDANEGFAWSMTLFEYKATEVSTTPAHQNVDGEVSFNISNPALLSLQSSSGCSGSSVQYPDYFYGNIVYECIDPRIDTNTKTTFTYDAPSGLLSINQTWTCPDAKDPVSFFAAGSVNLTLTTSKTSYSNPDWKMGQTYASKTAISTGPSLVPITAFHISAVV